MTTINFVTLNLSHSNNIILGKEFKKKKLPFKINIFQEITLHIFITSIQINVYACRAVKSGG